MTQASHLIGTWLLFALWQSTLVLSAALLLGRLFQKTPWRSHDLHLFGIIAAVLAPMFSTIIASQSGGWFAAGRYTETFAPLFHRSNMLGMLLLVGMTLFAVILIRGIIASRKLMFRAKPFPNRESQEALLRSAETLQNVSLPILFTSPSVKSPTVWCWGLHPAVVLPEELAENLPAGERDAIFLHELAHITRHDHLTALLTRICGAFLFWNPLYWLALKQADLAADEACDLLVLARGKVSPETYTETLLRLAAGERYKPAFQFLSRKEKIMKRITTILDFGDQPKKPSVKASRLWQCSALTAALLLSVTLAFCQEKKESQTPQIVKMEPANGADNVDADSVTELRVTFDRDMNTGTFSWCGGGEMYPETSGDPKWIDKRTCVLPVKLQPGQKYMLGINSQKFRNFKSAGGVPVVPVAYTFTTKADTEDRVKEYDVNKSVADFPADEIDQASPEAAYALGNRIIAGDNSDKVNELAQYMLTQTVPKNMAEWIEGMTPETRESMQNAKILKVFVYKNRDAMVIAEIEADERYNSRLMSNQDGLWFNAGGGGFVKGNHETCLKIYETAFMTAVARWDSEKETSAWTTPDNVGHTHLVGFAPVGDFAPQTPGELLEKLNETLQKAQNVTTGYFRTWPQDGRLIGAICTNNPSSLRRIIEEIPELELIGVKQLDEKMFNAHQRKPQLSLYDNGVDESNWKTPDNVGHTHLVGFAPVGDFAPQTPIELLEKLGETLQKAQNVTTGYFRTWPQDGRLIGAICTNNPAGLRRIIESIPELELIGVKQLDEKMFNAHQRKPQLSLYDDGTDETKLPKILKMEPANGAEDVDASAVTELRVTFDREMNTDGYSWCGSGETCPETSGSPQWIDKRTCVLPVKLQPGKKYMLGINAQDFRNFKSAEGVAVVPVMYTFKTKYSGCEKE